MTFEEWWEEDRVGFSREEELMRALHIDEWKVGSMLQQAYEAGRKGGYLEGHNDGYKAGKDCGWNEAMDEVSK